MSSLRQLSLVTIGLMTLSFGIYGAVSLLDDYGGDRIRYSEKIIVPIPPLDTAHSNQQISPALRREFSLLKQEIDTLRNQFKEITSESAFKEQANSDFSAPIGADLEPERQLLDSESESETEIFLARKGTPFPDFEPGPHP